MRNKKDGSCVSITTRKDLKDKKAVLLYTFAIANLAIVPHSLIAFRVNIIRIQSEVGKFPLQALGFDLLKGCFANKVSRLGKHEGKLFTQSTFQVLESINHGNWNKNCLRSCKK